MIRKRWNRGGGTLLLACLLTTTAAANDLQITGVTLVGTDPVQHVVQVQCDVSWENAWRTTAAPGNHDAVWLFVKYRVGGGPWQHATLDAAGHVVPAGALLEAPADNVGVFLSRADEGAGLVSFTGLQLRWNYGADGVPDAAADVEVRVLGIEMVYVPEALFAAGSGGHGEDEFTLTTIDTGDATVPPAGTGTLGGEAGGYPTGQTAPDGPDWPNGFRAFYVMKYEITQEQYAAFLNMLTYDQQAARTEVSPDDPAGTPALRAKNPRGNGIEIRIPGVPGVTPAVYGLDLTDDGLYDQDSDGQTVACNYLAWGDGTAYADWAGLRPMTELEYEKAARGPLMPVPDEYAWGDTTLHREPYVLTNANRFDERVSNPDSVRGNVAFSKTTGQMDAPLRVGIFAASLSPATRVSAGASYYGVMELSGNLWERTVSIGVPEGRAFTGAHGDGALDAAGLADVPGWPGEDALGSGFRGGSWLKRFARIRVSDRGIATGASAGRANSVGWRGVRSAY